MTTDPNILSIENPAESEVLLMTEESSTWLMDLGASYHVVALFRDCVWKGRTTGVLDQEEREREKKKERETKVVYINIYKDLYKAARRLLGRA